VRWRASGNERLELNGRFGDLAIAVHADADRSAVACYEY
jgi:hypothetical protein